MDPQIRNNPEQVAKKLLQKLQAQPYWIQIDSLERLLNPEQTEETGFVDDYWVTFLKQCLTASGFKSRLVLTSQALPTVLAEFSNSYGNFWQAMTLHGLVVDDEHNEHLQLFEKNGLTVDATTTVPLSRIGRIYEGHPLVLQVITGEIKAVPFGGDVVTYWRRYGDEFEQVARELEVQPANSAPRNQALKKQVHRRIGKSLKQLPPVALDLLCRSAVYRRPVLETFWLAMIKESTEQEQQVAYEILGDRILVEREGVHQGQFLIRQHNLIRSIAYDLLRENPSTWETAERQAADLWLTAYKPAGDVPNLEKVRGYLEAFYHYYEVEDWAIVSKLLYSQLDNGNDLYWQLQIWGYYQEQIPLYSKLIKISRKIYDENGESAALCNLGNVYYILGQYNQAIQCHKQQLDIACKSNNLISKRQALTGLANAHYSLGEYEQALLFLQQCLIIAHKTNDHKGKGVAFGNMGNIYKSLGKYKKAIYCCKRHLAITRFHQYRDYKGEGNALGNLGNIHNSLGQYDQAINFLEQRRTIAIKLDDPIGEGSALANIGIAQLKRGQYPASLNNNQEALRIFQAIGFQEGEAKVLRGLAELHKALGEIEMARQYCQQALALATELGIPLATECEALQLKLENDDKKENQ